MRSLGTCAAHGAPRSQPARAPCPSAPPALRAARGRAALCARAALSGAAARAAARGAAAKGAPADKWWKKDADLWVECHTDAEFRDAITSGDKPLVCVDFFATWCHGCQRAYPELCNFARDPELTGRVKFVKVCIEELKRPAKEAGVKSLPMVVVYDPRGGRRLAGINVPPSKAKNLKVNLETILANMDQDFEVDADGLVHPVPRAADADTTAGAGSSGNGSNGSSSGSATPTASMAAPREAVAEALQSGADWVHERFAQLDARGRDTAAAAAAAAASNGHTNGAAGAAAAGAAGAKEGAAVELLGTWDPEAAAAKAEFLRAYGGTYGYGGRIDQLYKRELGGRMGPDEHYLDYTGSSLYANSQLRAVFKDLRRHLFGNPHSANPSSTLAGERVEEARDIVLRFFNADPAEYQVVFTRSATDALKTVGETYPWSPASSFAYLKENHNSVLGVREYARQAGGRFHAVSDRTVDAWLADGSGADLTQFLDSSAFSSDRQEVDGPEDDGSVVHNLFAFPAEDNFAGVKYPLRWVPAIQAKSTPQQRWRVMLDAAAYVPTQPLDLSAVRPDFVSLSFYKIFGYPTGLGALIVRVDAAADLEKTFWGGGSVALASSRADFRVLKCRPSEMLEDGTVAFLDIASLAHGFRLLAGLGGVTAIQAHVEALRAWTYEALASLHHSNGRGVVALFGNHHQPGAAAVQGGIFNFALLKPDGSLFSYKGFEAAAAEAGIHVRTGSECNPGACYTYLGVEDSEVAALAGSKEGCHDDVEYTTVPRGEVPVMHGAWESLDGGDGRRVRMVDVPLGSVRASLGHLSTWEDCYALVKFIERRYVDAKDEPREDCYALVKLEERRYVDAIEEPR